MFVRRKPSSFRQEKKKRQHHCVLIALLFLYSFINYNRRMDSQLSIFIYSINCGISSFDEYWKRVRKLINRNRALCFQVSQKSGIWEGANSSGAAEGPSRSVSHAASLDAISRRTIKPETARAPCRSLTCSVCKYTMIFLSPLRTVLFHSSCRDLSDLALVLSVKRCFILWPMIYTCFPGCALRFSHGRRNIYLSNINK